MPNIHARNHIKIIGVPNYPSLDSITKKRKHKKEMKGVYILDLEGKVIPEVYEVLDLIADADIILGTSHLSLEEIFALVKVTKERGVKKILITYPESRLVNMSVEDQVELANMGAILEHDMYSFMPVCQ